METKREKQAIFNVGIDLTVPIDKTAFYEAQNRTDTCFGKLWNLEDNECRGCADKDVCGIMSKDHTTKKADKIAAERGIEYLDITDFHACTDDVVFAFIKSGVTTSKELLSFIMKTARTSDDVAAIEWIKRFIEKQRPKVRITKGIVWVDQS